MEGGGGRFTQTNMALVVAVQRKLRRNWKPPKKKVLVNQRKISMGRSSNGKFH